MAAPPGDTQAPELVREIAGWLDRQALLDPDTLLGALLLLAVVLLAAMLASRILGRVLTRSNLLAARIGNRTLDETFLRYALRVKSVLVYLAAGALYASLVPGLRALLGTVVASAGITAVVVGFAAKSTLANLISGLSLIFYRPIRIGDKVSIEGVNGTVEDITLRHTIVRNWENKRLVIPNEKIDQMGLVNYSLTDPKLLLAVDMGVSYDTDLDLARRLILEEAARNPHLLPADQAPNPPVVRVVEWAESAVILRALIWVPDWDKYFLAKFHLLEEVKKRFDAQGVEIPFPYRTLVYKRDLPTPPRETAAAPDQADQAGRPGDPGRTA
ncbi:MAG: mechanosensitive ion channel family protein [Thermodesulfobacteriota bacterium]